MDACSAFPLSLFKFIAHQIAISSSFIIPEILSSPGVVKVNVGGTARLLWGTDIADGLQASAFHTSSSISNLVVFWFAGTAFFTDKYKARADQLKHGTSWGFSLNDVTESDALNYIFRLDSRTINNDATIYVYSKLHLQLLHQ